MSLNIVAVLSSTVLTPGGTYKCSYFVPVENSLRGIPHYIGHPSTRAVVEELGAMPAAEKFFPGLQPGEAYIAARLRQSSNVGRAETGMTRDTQASIDDLELVLVERVA